MMNVTILYLGTIATIVVTAMLVSCYLEIRSQELLTPVKLELQVLGSLWSSGLRLMASVLTTG